jgi:hypothetical protein
MPQIAKTAMRQERRFATARVKVSGTLWSSDLLQRILLPVVTIQARLFDKKRHETPTMLWLIYKLCLPYGAEIISCVIFKLPKYWMMGTALSTLVCVCFLLSFQVRFCDSQPENECFYIIIMYPFRLIYY